MNSTSIGECNYCEQYFCIECLNAEDPNRFCSKHCEKSYIEEEE